MIIVKAPLRISFVGGGSDLPEFYRKTPGKVVSATIDKFVFVALNPAPLLKGIAARYSQTEYVLKPEELKNDRIREVLLKFDMRDNMEIGVFSHLQTGTGLGGSSSFTVALIKGIAAYKGRRLDKKELAELACEVEMDLIKDPVGKQDQYAASYGGFNIFQFNPDESVDTESLLLDYKTRLDFENHILIFFTGITRKSSGILSEQKNNTLKKLNSIKEMTKLVDKFQRKLSNGKFKDLGEILHENWMLKKTLSDKISNDRLDELYKSGVRSGAWGGKILGAGGGGCIMFFVGPEKKEKVRATLLQKARELKFKDFQEFKIKFVHSGAEIITNTFHG